MYLQSNQKHQKTYKKKNQQKLQFKKRKEKKKSHQSQTSSSEYVKHFKRDVIKPNIQCIIKFKIFNKILK